MSRSVPTPGPLFGTGVRPREYDGRLRGTTAFVADVTVPGCLHATFVRSTEAAADIIGIDTTEAAAMPGVVLVATGRDLQEQGLAPRPDPGRAEAVFAAFYDWWAAPVSIPAVAVDDVRHVGQAVAVVVATDRYLAEDAAETVEIDYAPHRAVVDAARALDPDSHIVHRGAASNLAARMRYSKGDVDAARARPGTVTVEASYEIGRQTALPMEGRGILAAPEPDGRLRVVSSTQSPFVLVRTLADALGCDRDRIHVDSPAVGGAFGQKTMVYGEELAVAFLAARTGSPISWVEDRYENFVAATQGRDQRHRVRLTVDADGRALALEDDFDVDFGAHCVIRSGVLGNTAIHLMGPYRIPSVRISGTGVFSNKAPTAQYRGAGRPEAAFALERTLDAAATRLGISRGKIREINLLGPTDLPHHQGVPYRDGEEIVYDGRDYQAVARAAWELVPEAEIAALRAAAGPGRSVGVGIATYVEATGRGPDKDHVRALLTPEGTVVVETGGGASGQAHETALGQIAADAACVPFSQVDVRTGHVEHLPGAIPTAASRTAVLTGSATHLAGLALVRRAVEAIELARGVEGVTHDVDGFHVPSGEVLTWADVGSWLDETGMLPGFGELAVVQGYAPARATWTMGAHVVVVEVDRRTGHITLLRYAVAEESGLSINERLVEGQIRGGVAQGVGSAMFEEFRYDRIGQPLTTTLADYLVPQATDLPRVRIAHLLVPSEHNPLGVRGVGESGVIAGPAAVASAVADALSDLGISPNRSPVVPADLLPGLAASAARSAP